MANFNDCRYATLKDITGLNGHWQDLYYIALGGTQPRVIHINQLEYDWLGSQGATAEHLNDRWYEFLTGAGYTQPALQDKLFAWWCDGAPGLGEGGDTPAFLAASHDPDTYEMLGVVEGTGDISVTSTSTHYAPDFEGIYREYAANTPVYSGGRVVTNYAETDPEGWITKNSITMVGGQSDPDGGLTATRLTATNDIASTRELTGIPVGNTMRNSVWVRRVTGTGNINIYTGNSTLGTNIAAELTTNWQRFAADVATAAGSVYIGIIISVDGDEIDIWHPQSEDISGQTNQNPSEFAGPVIAYGSPVTATYANLNGNTVTSNVVTEAVGDALSEVPWLQYYPAGTNDCKYSNDLTNGWGLNNVSTTFDQIGLTGAANTASRCECSVTGSNRGLSVSQTLSADGSYTVKATFKAEVGNWVRLRTFNFSVTPVEAWFNISTGVAGTTTNVTATEVIDLGDGKYTLLMQSNTVTDVGGLVYIYFADADGSVTATAGQAFIHYNAEIHANKTIEAVKGLDPIFTTTAAVSTTATEYSFDLANNDQDGSAWYLEWMPSYASTATTIQSTTMTTQSSNNGQLYWLNRASLRSFDGTNIADTGPDARPSDQMYKLALAYHGSDALMFAEVDSVRSPDTTYDGAYSVALGQIDIFANNTEGPARIRSLRRYDITSYDQGKTIIDGLMT